MTLVVLTILGGLSRFKPKGIDNNERVTYGLLASTVLLHSLKLGRCRLTNIFSVVSVLLWAIVNSCGLLWLRAGIDLRLVCIRLLMMLLPGYYGVGMFKAWVPCGGGL